MLEDISQQAPTLLGAVFIALSLAYAVVKKWPEIIATKKKDGDESNDAREKLRQAFRDDIEELRGDVRNLYRLRNGLEEEAERAAGRLVRLEQQMEKVKDEVADTGKIVISWNWRLARLEREMDKRGLMGD
jgi:chromosome segregation ATPase